MHLTAENILLTGSILLLTSIVAGKTTKQLGLPTLILFLVIGMLGFVATVALAKFLMRGEVIE